MNRLNRQMEYGLMALKILALKKPGEMTSAKEVADSTGTPFDPMARVLQQLKQKGFLRGEHGPQGGYVLTKDLSSVSFHDFTASLVGETNLARCLHSKSDCDLVSNCNIISPIQNLNRKLEEFYKSLTLQEILFLKNESAHPNGKEARI